MCQVPEEASWQSQFAAECIGVVAVAVVMGWALSHLVAVYGDELGEEMALLGVGLGLLAGLALVFQEIMVALQKAITVANSHPCSALRRCNEAKLIAEALEAHESNDGVVEVRKALQKVRETAQVADKAFSAIHLKVTKDEEVTTFKERAEEVSTAAGKAVKLCLRALGVTEVKLRAADAPLRAAAAAAAVWWKR